jgi:quercetin dioxygenase-like cupin family protein
MKSEKLFPPCGERGDRSHSHRFYHVSCPAGEPQSPTPTGETVTKVMQQPFSSPAKPVFDMLTIDHLAPDAAVPAHKHPGPVFAYVLQGELVTRIGTGPEETLKPGQTYYLPAGVIHHEARNPSSSAHTKLLSIEVAPEGQPFVLPAGGSGVAQP